MSVSDVFQEKEKQCLSACPAGGWFRIGWRHLLQGWKEPLIPLRKKQQDVSVIQWLLNSSFNSQQTWNPEEIWTEARSLVKFYFIYLFILKLPAMLGTSTTILRDLMFSVIIMRARIGLGKENASGLWLLWVVWAAAQWPQVCSGSCAASAGWALLSPVAALSLSYVLHFTTWLQVKSYAPPSFLFTEPFFYATSREWWLFFLLPLRKPEFPLAFLN